MIWLVLASTVVDAANCPSPTNVRYSVKIDSVPRGATIYLNDKECGAIGTTPWSGKLPRGKFAVVVEAPGYEVATKTFSVAAVRRRQSLFVPLIKKREPPQIDVRGDVDRNMIGAQISLDGVARGTVPTVIVTTPGRHLLEVRKDGFEAYSTWVETKDDQVLSIAPSLREVQKAKHGSVLVNSDAAEAEIWIDGRRHSDATPSVINQVMEGVHLIEVRKPPAQPWRQTITVVANQQTKVHADIVARSKAAVGVVRVISDNEGAHVFIDGIDKGPTPVDIEDVRVGEHIIQLKAPGYQSGETRVTVTAGGSHVVKLDLDAAKSRDEGTLKVVSTVPEAEVFIDGAAIGSSPQEKRLAAGTHTVTVRRPGFKEFSQSVMVEAGGTLSMQAELRAVGRLRVLSTPRDATVFINGLPAKDDAGQELRTPLDVEVEAGEAVVRIEAAGYQPFEQSLAIEGGKAHTLSRELAVAGLSESELLLQQRGLTSYSAHTLPRGRATVDAEMGYPYFLSSRLTVGAGALTKNLAFDANVAIRTMLARTELGIGGRVMLAERNPFAAGLFTQLWWGSSLLDDSARNGMTWDVGGAVSLTALRMLTITGRAYLQLWSDRHCPGLGNANTATGFANSEPTAICKEYKRVVIDGGALSDGYTLDDLQRAERLTDSNGRGFFGRENGLRVVFSLAAEVAFQQHWNLYGILEGAPVNSERALYTSLFSRPMFETDFQLYLRLGVSRKF